MKSFRFYNICFVALIFLIFNTTKSLSQNTSNGFRASVRITNGQGICHVVLPDSVGWSSINLEIKDKIRDSVLFNREYVFDQTTGLPTGITWVRDGNDVYLGTGNIPSKLGYRGKVRLKDSSGQWGDPLQFIFQ